MREFDESVGGPCEEDVLTLALFEQVAEKFFENRKNRLYGIDGKNSDKENGVLSV